MAQNEHLPFVNAKYEIWLSKYVDSSFEEFLVRNFCNNSFTQCVQFYRLILNELCDASRGIFSFVTYIGNGVWRYDIPSIGGYFTFTIVDYNGVRALYIIDLNFPMPLTPPFHLLREHKAIKITETNLRSIIRETLRRILLTS